MKVLYNFDELYEENNNIALFDYTAKTTEAIMKPNNCGNLDCLSGIINPIPSNECMNYNQCLQYFNTLPYTNCIDNVPVPHFIIDEDLEDYSGVV